MEFICMQSAVVHSKTLDLHNDELCKQNLEGAWRDNLALVSCACVQCIRRSGEVYFVVKACS